MPSADLAHQHAVHTLYEDHHPWLCGWLRKKLGCVDHAADLAQDTFIRVLIQRKAAELREPRAYLSEVDRLLDGLGERTREIFLMAQLDGLTYVEISRRMGVSVNTVKKHAVRALTHCLMLAEE
jgi:DNA-directed RNA polymerase specialized sigma24 family protein